MQIRFYLAAGIAALSVASLAPTPVHAQQITSGIEGNVTDKSGVPISGAEVTVTDTRTGATRTTTTGAGGNFNTTSLVTGGPYTVTVSADGFEGQAIEGIQTSLQGNTACLLL